MDVDLTLESEKFTGTSVVRAFFLRDNRETHMYNETLTMNQQTDPQLKCTDVTAYLIVSSTMCTAYPFSCFLMWNFCTVVNSEANFVHE